MLLGLLVSLAGCSREPPEQALRATIAAMEAAAEARDSEALLERLSEDFVGPDGMDRERFRRYLALIWLRNREVGVGLGPIQVELVGLGARAEFTATTRGGGGLVPDRVYRVKTGWRMEAGQWRLLSAEWEPVL